MLANNSAVAISRLILTCEAALHPGGWLAENSGGIIVYYSLNEAANYVFVLVSSYILDALIYNEGGPALNDLQMGSSLDLYINHPNTNYENSIAKIGIAGVEDYPQIYRLGAAGVGISENQMLNTVNYVKDYKFMVLIADFVNYAEHQHPRTWHICKNHWEHYQSFWNSLKLGICWFLVAQVGNLMA